MTSSTTDIYQVQNIHLGDNRLEVVLKVPSNLIYFDGHFDEMAVLPGVVQVHWAIEMAKKNFDIQDNFTAIEVLKFMRVIQPDDIVTLNLDYSPLKSRLNFTYKTSDHVHSKGKVKFNA